MKFKLVTFRLFCMNVKSLCEMAKAITFKSSSVDRKNQKIMFCPLRKRKLEQCIFSSVANPESL